MDKEVAKLNTPKQAFLEVANIRINQTLSLCWPLYIRCNHHSQIYRCSHCVDASLMNEAWQPPNPNFYSLITDDKIASRYPYKENIRLVTKLKACR